MKLPYFLVIIIQITLVKSLNETSSGNVKKYFFKMKQNSSDFIITSRIPHLGPKELEYPVIQKKLTGTNQESVKNMTDELLDQIETEETTTKKSIITSRIPHLGPKQLEYPVIQKKTTYKTTVTEEPSTENIETTSKSVMESLASKIFQEKNVFDENVTEIMINKIEPKVVQAFMEKVTKFAGQCLQETKASNDDMAKLMAHEIPSTHEGICMISCMYKAFGVQNDDGTMNPDEAINLISKIKESDPDLYEKMVGVVNKCRDIPVDEDACTTALNTSNCLMKEAKETGLTPDMFGV